MYFLNCVLSGAGTTYLMRLNSAGHDVQLLSRFVNVQRTGFHSEGHFVRHTSHA
jgi:hypothetical protein